MIFKENRQRFFERNNLVFLAVFIALGIAFALAGIPRVTSVYGFAILIYTSFLLLGPPFMSKTCVEKRTISFSLCLVLGAIVEAVGEA